ncbi:MAG: alpha/beta fold hydrolase [Methylophilaceae bacterium]|nr:alpha/beta fold hydrolase [Methylophilaceae bacterium]
MMTVQNLATLIGKTGFYEQRGDDVVLLIHGLTGTPTEMRHFAKSLSKQGFSVVCPQLAGHCGSINDLKRSTWRDWYNSISETFLALKKNHQHVFVSGLSMGALIALKLAEDQSSQVAGLGLLSTTFFYDGWNMPNFKRRLLLPIVINTPLKHFLSWKENPPYGIKCERTRALVHAVLENRDAHATEKVGIFRTPGVTIKESTRLIKVARKSLPKVSAPVLLVHSTEDDMASIKNAQFVAKHVGSLRVETFFVNDTYHVLTLDKRKHDIAKKMGAFFKRCITTTDNL